VTGLWVLPFLVAGLLGTILLVGAHAGATTPERELRGLVREDQLARLVASLREEPALVRSARCSTIRNRLVLDLGEVELDVCCYAPPSRPVDLVTAVYYRSSVGWVVETAGRGGAARLHGWLLDVRSSRRTR
jgi:hypothetical protein